MSRQIMTFFTSKDHPGSIFLICDLFLDSHRLSGILVPKEIITILTFLTIQSLFRWSATKLGTCRLSGIFGANADNDILE
jgi:hypothetical protein